MCLPLCSRERIAAGRWWIAMLQSTVGLGVTSLIGRGAAWAVYKTALGKFAPDCISLTSLPTLLFPTQIPSSFKGNKHLQRHNVNCYTQHCCLHFWCRQVKAVKAIQMAKTSQKSCSGWNNKGLDSDFVYGGILRWLQRMGIRIWRPKRVQTK